MPLFLRKERGDLKLAKFKLRDAKFDLDNAEIELKNKIVALYRELESFETQNVLIDDIVESKLIDAELKQIEVENKFYATKAKLFNSLATMLNQSVEKSIPELIEKSLSKAISYLDYRNLVAKLAEEGKSTGPEQTEALANYTQLNHRRMKRWDKTLKFNEEAVAEIAKIDHKLTWLVLTESWCGDASPALPVMHKITELNANISLKIILRDENVDLMNQFLTNGGMSIPKLIAIDDNLEVIGDWGPRSEAATKLVDDHKAEHGMIKPEFKEDIQIWYNKDKGQSVLKDLLASLSLK
ncbi:hypothetical protein GQR58_026863 [Nymphon striatum]|nr:hypothetical protein GQR58_026863 [Nymphon striatum]